MSTFILADNVPASDGTKIVTAPSSIGAGTLRISSKSYAGITKQQSINIDAQPSPITAVAISDGRYGTKQTSGNIDVGSFIDNVFIWYKGWNDVARCQGYIGGEWIQFSGYAGSWATVTDGDWRALGQGYNFGSLIMSNAQIQIYPCNYSTPIYYIAKLTAPFTITKTP